MPAVAALLTPASAVLARMQYHFNVQPYTQRCLGTVDFLVDIEMLAHTDYAVLTFNSGLAHLVDTLRCARLLSPCIPRRVPPHSCVLGLTGA